jgi:predicted acetyltransferase
MHLTQPPRLTQPTTAVRESWLAAEQAEVDLGGSAELLNRALADFGELVADRTGVHTRWGVPTTVFWYVSGKHYVGELVIRHELTPELLRSGGHIGYSVAPPWRRQGHGTALLAAGLGQARLLGLPRVMLTIDTQNEASRRVALANGATHDGEAGGEDRFWIALGEPPGEG